MLQRESNADETLPVSTEEKYKHRGGVLPLQVATEFIQHIPVRC
jgi:hypothetical protein